jgi:hypothetical protein
VIHHSLEILVRIVVNLVLGPFEQNCSRDENEHGGQSRQTARRGFSIVGVVELIVFIVAQKPCLKLHHFVALSSDD